MCLYQKCGFCVSKDEDKKCDLPKSALFQSAKIIVQNAVKALTIQEIYVKINCIFFCRKDLTDYVVWRKIGTYIHTYIQYKSVIFQKYNRNIKGTLYISQKSK